MVAVRIGKKRACKVTLDLACRVDKSHNTACIFRFKRGEDGVGVAAFRSRTDESREVKLLTVFCTECHIFGGAVCILHVFYCDTVLSCSHIKVVDGVEKHRLFHVFDRVSAVGAGISRVARISDVCVACIIRKLQYSLVRGKLEGRALDISLAPYGAVAILFVTDFDRGGSVLGKLFVCQVCPDERNGNRHIVLGPAELI